MSKEIVGIRGCFLVCGTAVWLGAFAAAQDSPRTLQDLKPIGRLQGDEVQREAELLRVANIRPVTREAITTLTAAFGDESDLVRQSALRSIAALGAEARAAAPALLTLALERQKPAWLRSRTLSVLATIGGCSPEAVADLVGLGQDGGESLLVRISAVTSLGDFTLLGDEQRRSVAAAVTPLLRRIAREDPSALLRAKVWECLAKCDPADPEAIRSLLEVSKGRLGAVAVVIEGPLSTSFDVSAEAIRTMIRIGRTEEVTPILMSKLEGMAEERATAAFILSEMGPSAKSAVPALVKALERDDEAPDEVAVKTMVLRALVRIAPDSKLVISAIEGVKSRSSNERVRDLADRSLQHARNAVPRENAKP